MSKNPKEWFQQAEYDMKTAEAMYLISPVKKPTKVTGKETGQREERAVISDSGQA